MNKSIFCSLAILLAIPFITHPAASDHAMATSPGGASLTDYVFGLARAGYGKIEKLTGTKPVGYCIDKPAQGILKGSEQMLELTLADNRVALKTKTYGQLMANPTFQMWIKQLNDRAYFEWLHIRDAIAQDRSRDVLKFWKINRINLSPCLRVAIRLYLEQDRAKKQAAPDPKNTVIRFDLNRINHKPGYVEATMPTFAQESAKFPELTQTIRDFSDSLSIASPIQSAERRARKSFDPRFSLDYLTSDHEINKAHRIYDVFLAHLFQAKIMNDSISELFCNEEFLKVYNQAWDRDTHLRCTLNDLLTRGSLDACSIYAHHRYNISPLFAALVCDMILSHQQQEHLKEVPQTFTDIFFNEKKPYGKYVFMFLNSLTKNQKIALYNAQERIAALSPEEQSTAVHQAVRADKAQLQLIAEIQRGSHMPQLLASIKTARSDIQPELYPMQALQSAQPSGEFVLALDLADNGSSSSGSQLRSAGDSDDVQ